MARFFFNCTGGQTYYEWNEKAYPSNYYAGRSPWDWNGHYRSLVMFNSADIRAKLTGMRVTGCYLDIYVDDSYYETFNLYIGTHNYTAVPDVWSSSRVNRNRLNRNEQPRGQISGWSLGTTIGTEFKDGVSTGIALGPTPSESANYYYEIAPNGHSREPVLIIDAETINVAPNAPVLNEPAPDAVIDTHNLGVTMSWTHTDPNGDPMSAWRLRRKLPNGSFDYWNGTAFTATQTDMTVAPGAGGLIIPPGVWASNQRIEWSVATRDASGLWSSWSAARVLFSSIRPTTTLTAPPASSDTPRPTLRWTYADPDGNPQYGWAAQIVPPAAYTDPSWNPDTYLRNVWSTSGNTTATAVAVGVDLRNHNTYRAYVKTASSPNPTSGLQWSNWSWREFQVVVPPSPSQVTYPYNGSVADLGSGFTMAWNNAFYQNVGSQTAFAIRRLQAGVYRWWNGSAWIATETYLPGAQDTYSFRPGDVANGQSYTFSVSIRDDYNKVSPYSAGVTVEASTAAQVTVIAPPATSVVSNPTVTWTMYDIENDPQQTYQVRVIHNDVYNVGTNINPLTAAAVWDTGEVVDSGGSTRNVQIPVDLQNANRYRAYVRVRTNGVYSGWSYAEFNVSLVPPALPSASVTVGEHYTEITIQGRDSMLGDNASRNFGDWDPAVNATVTNAVQFGSSASGYASTIRSVAAGTMTAVTHEAWPVAPGQTYTGAVTLLATVGAAAVSAYISIEWLDVNAALVGVSSPQPITNDSAVRSSITAVAPAQASYGRLRITFQSVPAANAAHQFFNPVLRPGTGDEWTPGGTLTKTFATVKELGDNRLIRFGTNIPLPVDTQKVVIRDYEVPAGRQQEYSVSVRAVYPNAALVSNPQTLAPVTWVSGWLWLSDPLRPGSGRSFAPQSFDAITRPVRQGKFRPIGRPDAVITTGVRGLREGAFTIVTHDRGTRDEYRELADLTETMLIRVPPDTADPRISDAEGETIYVRLEGDAPEERPLPSRTPHRIIKQSWTEQRAPSTNYDYEAGN